MFELRKIDIIIDGITDCLVERASEKRIDTEISEVSFRCRLPGWKFDWSEPERQGSSVYALRVKGDPEAVIQGLVAFHEDKENECVYGDLLESNSENIGRDGKYLGVGAHLTAFACKTARSLGYDAFYFMAKTLLMDHYRKTLGATQIGSSALMGIFEPAFSNLINSYYEKEISDG
ncbi:MAG: hypothetical protein LBL23_06335 [Coriobacteriales bacterium]|jgi:hypothetical protein|nr:hypothetical protein [Coriobacteriales bacterium]